MIARVGVVAVLLGLTACGDPTTPNVDDVSDGALHLLGVLDPDSTLQTVWVTQVDSRGLSDLVVSLSEVLADGAVRQIATGTRDFLECQGRYYYPDAPGECHVFRAPVRAGHTYRILASGAGHPTASGDATIPGDFAIQSVEALGDPPGSESFRADWSASVGAFRYVVSLVAKQSDLCADGCASLPGPAWSAVTAATAVAAVIPPALRISDVNGPVQFLVYAMNRDLFEYLTTGTPGAFTVLPRQNVQGGFGVVGAWVRRVVTLPRTRPGSRATNVPPRR